MIENGKVGKWTYWYENGSRKMMGTYKDNKKNGDWIFWHQNSFKHSEGRYLQDEFQGCLLYTSPSPRDLAVSRMPSSA